MQLASKKSIVLPFHKKGKSYVFASSEFDRAVKAGLFSPNPKLDEFIEEKRKP
jgi:hypothetical protein